MCVTFVLIACAVLYMELDDVLFKPPHTSQAQIYVCRRLLESGAVRRFSEHALLICIRMAYVYIIYMWHMCHMWHAHGRGTEELILILSACFISLMHDVRRRSEERRGANIYIARVIVCLINCCSYPSK